ncbi:MAG: cheB 7 [Firmicutes bacterium]|nr:cheB 7 [Bacillota bacterium]
MSEQIKIVVVDDVEATRENIKKLIEFEPDIEVIGEAPSASEAIRVAKTLKPDIVVMDINMPGMDGISATEIMATEAPGCAIIIMSVQAEQEYLRRAMIAGAKDYLNKPFSGAELSQAVRQVYTNERKRKRGLTVEGKTEEPGKIITVFSTKGGVGKTTLATNLAVALASRTEAKVGLVDADLQFGDVALFLNLLPRTTIADLVRDIDSLDDKILERYVTEYNEHLRVLAAPVRPEQADTVTPAHIEKVLRSMRDVYKYIIVDTTPSFSEVMLSVLDASDLILIVSAMDLPTIKNVKLCLEIMESLNYPPEKLQLVLNRANTEGGIDVAEVEESLRQRFSVTLPNDGKVVMTSVNRGIPFVSGYPEAPVSQRVLHLAKSIATSDWQGEKERQGVVGKLRRLIG